SFFFSSRRRHTRSTRDWSSDVCSSDLWGASGFASEAMRRVFVDPEAPQRDALQEAAKWIRTGGLVALPTDTLYGLAADPFRADAVARVFTVKGRAEGRAPPLIAADADQIAARLSPLSPLADPLAAKSRPRPITLLRPA